ncbi:type II toxin-antitoxin system CcdA family antitoxin [Roseomonas sp. PWR1]|uniref:Type II toxin-antitoxin system CcdA family antitoxin n=1 Tax=Roseomonas nitratireducens TaxID=2820810 RepID=A0ABS4AWC1_9PROT|nr:type II toxin-antitoxin system CcdA family antitoxin [Neoroseomonas nitratireducens]MBP0465071.1 type II toxin-antitoxin system CcdA family antitoxin [Neoroseomonas nitratireducens]
MGHDRRPPKRPVNLSLSEELVREARGLTPNLSDTVEALLAEFVAAEKRRRAEADAEVAALVAASNRFIAAHGAFGDEFSTL